MVHIGKNILDVGCGTCWLKNLMPKETSYVGMDAYPKFASDDVICDTMEDCGADDNFYDTLFVFAAWMA